MIRIHLKRGGLRLRTYGEFMRLKKIIRKQGFSLIELLMGIVVGGVVIGIASGFYSKYEKVQLRFKLKTNANSEMAEFFKFRRKSFNKVKPGSISTALTGPFQSFNIPKTVFDSRYRELLENETLRIDCTSLPADPNLLANIPPQFNCPGVCGGRIPASVSVLKNGVQTERYPFASGTSFPKGSAGSQAIASLCVQKMADTVSLKLTYLLRYDSSSVLEPITRTEVFNLPVAGPNDKSLIISTGQ